MAERGQSIWANSFDGGADRSAPYGDPLANPFKPAAKAPGFGHAEQLPQILGAVQSKQEAVSRAFEKGGRGKVRRSDALRIFVGGGGDGLFKNMVDQYERYQRDVDGPAAYFGHNEEDGIVKAIREATAKGIPVDVIGHSYGGMASFNAIVKAGDKGHVRNFITADPVGRFADADARPGNVENWINITADPARRDMSDWVADVGGKAVTGTPDIQEPQPWDILGRGSHRRVPTNYADQAVIVGRNHRDLAGMLRDADVPALLLRDDDVSDDADTPAWMENRNAQVRARRR